MFNEIRNDPAAGLADLPEATKQSLTDIRYILDRKPDIGNKLVTAMLVRIGMTFIRSTNFYDPLAVFEKSENPMGHQVQEIYIDPIHAERQYDGTGPNPLGRRTMDNVKVAYHNVNYQPQYAITVDRAGMMNAMRSWEDLDQFWGEQMNSMYVGNSIDNYRARMKVIADAIANTTPGSVIPSAYLGEIRPRDQASGLAFMQSLKYLVEDFKWPRTDNNIAGVTQATQPEELVLLINKDLKPNLDVYTLATIFNDSAANVNIRMISVDTFSNEATAGANTNANVLGLLTVPDFFQFYPAMRTVAPQPNEQGIFTNFFLNEWKILDVSPFWPAVTLRSGSAPEA